MIDDLRVSVVIPTMWRDPYHIQMMVSRYNEMDWISEVLIMDNDWQHGVYQNNIGFTYLKNFPNKVKIFTNGHNNFVNPSWNFLVSKASNDIVVIANDDILFKPEDLRVVLESYRDMKQTVMGLDYEGINNNSEKNTIKKVNAIKGQYIGRGFGALMIVRKSEWVNIPNQFEIYFGDNFLALRLENHYVMKFKNGLYTKMSVTSKSFENEYLRKEAVLWKNLIDRINELK